MKTEAGGIVQASGGGAARQINTIDEKRQELIKRRVSLLSSFSRAAQSGNSKRMADLYCKIRQINSFLETLGEIEVRTKPKTTDGVRRFAVSSLFLFESFKKLTADRDEQFFFVTGSEIEGVMVLDQWAEFAHQKRTMLGVTADQKSTHGLLIKLEQFGHRLLAHFHSHPGSGSDATHPSGTDNAFQQRLEKAGHMAVMAIFSRDGFVRFLRLDDKFEISIYGEGVEKHGENIFRLREIS